MSPLTKIYSVEEAQATILRRSAWDDIEVSESSREANRALFGEPIGPAEAVRRILADVRQRGDDALLDWTERLDGVRPSSIRVEVEEMSRAALMLDESIADALRLAAERIERFHRRQPVQSWVHENEEGSLGQLVRPISRVGIYVPGGTAPLPSTLLMTAIPARVAGVPHISVITPPDPNTMLPHPVTMAAAVVAGVDAVYVGGGAQAIGALAYGTESVPRVDKICGPGNLYTTLAKRQLFGEVGIDGLPGPTETLVIADEHANPVLAAADLLAQAEHDVLASAILLTPSRDLAGAVQAALANQLERLDRDEIAAAALARNSGIVVTADLDQAFDLANAYAPEHLCLLVDNPSSYLDRVQNAGGVFLGEESFEVLGDYVAGPSHVMPTGGTARFASPLNVLDFVKIVSVIALDRQTLTDIGPAAARLARAEGLTGHAAAVEFRLDRHGKESAKKESDDGPRSA